MSDNPPIDDLEGMDLEELLAELHDDRYRDVVKYLVLHPVARPAPDNLAVIAEHPLGYPDYPATDENQPLTGHGSTWTAATRDCLRQVREAYAHDLEAVISDNVARARELTHCPVCLRRWSEHSGEQFDRCAAELGARAPRARPAE